ncbi:hypothetical protein SAMN04487996_102113 [Dyadobacter soli]|uniref:Uncharacterized protein n=1 Tax=Dyadobacter soli TaxID=659014 RepID=A0A1G6XBW5_9BACT|nr:hypothetical protein [Dyadobacter soli]SDD75313.1 hypothetical protein SAMN04487996_102113 [Dyadobacter soli]
MAKNFNPPKVCKHTKHINASLTRENTHNDLVKLSFKYLDVEHEVFIFQNKETAYFNSLIHRLKHICCLKCKELKYPTVKALRNHFIRWGDTSQKCFGLPNEEQLVEQPFQFSVSANEHGRVIGFFIETTFYVVWLDVEHRTYG